MKSDLSTLEVTFNRLIEALTNKQDPSEQFTLKLSSERSQFVRFNQAKVRQTGWVSDGCVQLTLLREQRSSFREFPFTGDWEADWPQAQLALEELRQEVPQLPVDPYLVLLSGDHSRETCSGNLLALEAVVPTLLPPVADLDFTGIYAAGVLVRAYADSNGQKHWFATDLFTLDYSLFTRAGQAVKGTLAGSHWDTEVYKAKIEASKTQLRLLERPAKHLSPGQYRTYLAPAAVADLVTMLSWGSVSEASLQQGASALVSLRQEEKQLSPIFTLKENFQHGLVPRFNEWGETAPTELPVIQQGVLVNTLVNTRTAKEYHQTPNGANSAESLRSPEVTPGSLELEQILPTLDTGLYVSNVHYLNWSDRPTGRITGMTRYACFWVEKGELIAPIENLRFDESLYRFWGENLVDFTNFQEFTPEVDTYGGRQPGGSRVPGMLVADFTYTL